MSKQGEISYAELKDLSESIQNGLNKMLKFEKKLHKFDKGTLSAFLALTIKNKNFSETLSLLHRLETMLKD